MINNGFDVKAISEHLGHCNINITADTYGHIFDEYKARIAKSLEDSLFKITEYNPFGLCSVVDLFADLLNAHFK